MRRALFLCICFACSDIKSEKRESTAPTNITPKKVQTIPVLTEVPPANPWKKRERGTYRPQEKQQTTEALRKAINWAESLNVDPLRVRNELQMKGIKFYAEYLDLLLLAYEWPDEVLAAEAKEKAMRALAVLDNDAYHALDTKNISRFREDSMSYLRVCMLAERFGYDTTNYRQKIFSLRELLYGDLAGRGVDNRLSFVLLFRQLNFPLAETEEDIYPGTILANKRPLSYFQTSADKPYDITHELFALSWRGYRAVPFRDTDEERYAKEIISALLLDSINKKNLDLAGEFVVNLAELGESKSDIVNEARALFFKGQNEDGSFGDYTKEATEMKKTRPLYDVRIGGNLHTTMVVLWALIETS